MSGMPWEAVGYPLYLLPASFKGEKSTGYLMLDGDC